MTSKSLGNAVRQPLSVSGNIANPNDSLLAEGSGYLIGKVSLVELNLDTATSLAHCILYLLGQVERTILDSLLDCILHLIADVRSVNLGLERSLLDSIRYGLDDCIKCAILDGKIADGSGRL